VEQNCIFLSKCYNEVKAKSNFNKNIFLIFIFINNIVSKTNAIKFFVVIKLLSSYIMDSASNNVFCVASTTTTSAATSTTTATSTTSVTSTASATGNTLDEATKNAHQSSILAVQGELRKLLPNDPNAHTAKTCLLNCIDFRLIDYETFLLDSTGYLYNFDEFILAGASLGYNGIDGYFSKWRNCCNDHIELSHKLHDISEVTIIDHMGCGAYKLQYKPEELAGDGEYNLHIENLNKAEKTIKKKFPFITKVTKYIMDLNGKASIIP
jgi:hypothetical protein